MSTPSVEIVHGDGKFELIAAVVECASSGNMKKRKPFKFTVKGPKWAFEENPAFPRNSAVVTINIKAFPTGFQSLGGGGEDWLLTGPLFENDLLSRRPEERRLLRPFEIFRAVYSLRTRNGHIEPF